MNFLSTYRSSYKKIWKLGLPVIAAQVGQITVGMVDNMMIGHLGRTELAAASFANTLFALPMIFGMGFAMAITPIVGKAFGGNGQDQIRNIKANAYFSNLLMGIFLFVSIIGLFIGMDKMGQPEDIMPLSKPYFAIIGSSIVPLMMFLAGKHVTEGMANMKVAMYITLGGNIVNIVGNIVLIHGYLGFPALGLNGAGIATLLARISMAVGMLIYLERHKNFNFMRGVKRHYLSRHQMRSLYTLGVPMGIHLFAEASAFIVSGIMMGWIGEVGLAAHQIVMSLSTLGFMIYQGIGVSSTVNISLINSPEHKDRLRKMSLAASHIVFAMVIVISIFFIIFRGWLPQLFTSDVAVIELAKQLIIVFVVFQLFDAFQIVFAGILRGMHDSKVPGVITVISYFFIAIPVSYFSAFHLGYNEVGIWFGFPVGLSLAATMFGIRIVKLINRM